MSRLILTAAAAVAGLALVVVAANPAAAGKGNGGKGRAKGKPTSARAALAVPELGPDEDAKGKLDVRHFPAVGKRVERSWLRFKLRKLDAESDYTLWVDDPSTEDVDLTQVGDAFTTDADGAANLRSDTKAGDTLPFGASLADLFGKALEVRDGDGSAVLEGQVPGSE